MFDQFNDINDTLFNTGCDIDIFEQITPDDHFENNQEFGLSSDSIEGSMFAEDTDPISLIGRESETLSGMDFVDMNHDGVVDTTVYDTNNDRIIDAVFSDVNGDTMMDRYISDDDYDGDIDTDLIDKDHDFELEIND